MATTADEEVEVGSRDREGRRGEGACVAVLALVERVDQTLAVEAAEAGVSLNRLASAKLSH